MRRREFLSLVGAMAASVQLAARAQERVRRIGVLSNPGPDDAEMQARSAAFVQRLQELGWTVGRNLQIDFRWSHGDAERLRSHAAELVALGPDVILATSGVSIMPLVQVSRSVPIVFAQTIDPVGLGVVESLSRPGGNITGFTQFEYGIVAKWLELLKQIAPAVTRVAVLRDPFDPAGLGQWAAMQPVASVFGIELSLINVREVEAIERGAELRVGVPEIRREAFRDVVVRAVLPGFADDLDRGRQRFLRRNHAAAACCWRGPSTSARLTIATSRSISSLSTAKCGVKRSEFKPPWMTPSPCSRSHSSVEPMP